MKVPLYSESQNHLVKIIIKLSTPGELASASTTFTIHICKFEVKLLGNLINLINNLIKMAIQICEISFTYSYPWK